MRGCLFVVLGLIGLGAIGSLFRRSDQAADQAAAQPELQDEEAGLRGVALLSVKKFLKSPESAEFPHSSDPSWVVKRERGGHYVGGEVTAVNALGVRIRQPFVVIVYANGDTLFPTYIEIDGEHVYGTRDVREEL